MTGPDYTCELERERTEIIGQKHRICSKRGARTTGQEHTEKETARNDRTETREAWGTVRNDQTGTREREQSEMTGQKHAKGKSTRREAVRNERTGAREGRKQSEMTGQEPAKGESSPK